MATYEVSLFSPTADVYYSAFTTQLVRTAGIFNPGVLCYATSGLCVKFRFWGTAIQQPHHTIPDGASYKVKIDGGSSTTYTGNGTTATTTSTNVWATGLSEGWHDVEILDIGANIYWNCTVADGGTANAAGGGGPTGGMLITYGTLPSGYSVPVDYAAGYGPTSTYAQLVSDLGAKARVLYNTQYQTYLDTIEFYGSTAVQYIRVNTPDSSSMELILFRSDANTPSSTAPCPYTATIVASTTSKDANGWMTITVPVSDGVLYRLVIGVSAVTNIHWSANSRPTIDAPNAISNYSAYFLGDSTLARGYTDGGSNPESLARGTPAYYWAKTGALTWGAGIDGSLSSLTTNNGTAAQNSNAALWTDRLNAAKNSQAKNIVYRGWINDVAFIQAAAVNAYVVPGYGSTRLITASTLAADLRAGFDVIWATDPTKRIFIATKYQGSSGATYDACVAAIAAMIATAQGAGKPIYGVDCSGWGAGGNAVVQQGGIHPISGETGAGNDAEKWYQAIAAVISTLTINSVTIVQGATLTMYGESTTTLTETIDATGGTPTGVAWSTVSGSPTVNAITGEVQAPGAGTSDKVSVIEARSSDDPTKYARITITTPASAAPTPTATGSRRRPTRGRG